MCLGENSDKSHAVCLGAAFMTVIVESCDYYQRVATIKTMDINH